DIKDIGAIMIYDSYHVSAINNIVDDSNFGIYVQNSRSCVIKNNSLTAYGKEEVQSGNGINCWRSDSLLIIGNKITGHRDGLYFEFVTNSLIWKNISTKNVRYGIHFMFSHHDTYIGNIFEENESGVAVMYTNHIQMYNNFFLNNWGDAAYGILLKDITDSDISGNHFTKNTVGIHMEGCSRINFYKNIFADNGWAVKIQASCDNNDFTNNNFTGNTFDIGTNGSLVLNTFNGNYWDKYEGYDLNKDKIGDVPYHPVSMYSMIIDSNPAALMLFRSLIVSLLDKSEKILPGITPESLKDEKPFMTRLPI
ncbi:MAG TPA: nitrous oxide reductase family maturation protein NosD, partial [Chitinophagaceae bacterium]|nr:nitrous oxide reductase family maturation protein NosD [Chitinophagaceae bacterium]